MQISIWEKESFYRQQDIIIAGSGFTALWTAWHIKKRSPKTSITIIEQGIIPTGASTRNAGFACFGSLTELLEDISKNGEDAMLDLVAMRYKGLQLIQQVFNEKTIDFTMVGGYELFTEKQSDTIQQLDDHIERLNKLLHPVVGKKHTFKLSSKKIDRFGFARIQALVENKLEGYLHSGKLCQALLQLVQQAGVQVLNGVKITGYTKTNEQVQVHNQQQLPISCNRLLICTNAFARQLLPQLDVNPARGQILLTSPIEKLTFDGTFHFEEGFYYFRNLGNRVLLGGARNKAFEAESTSDMHTTGFIQDTLEQFLATYILPGKTFTITDRWSGIMGMGAEKKPIVEQIEPNVFCAVRLSGMGVALAPVIGEKLAALALKA